MTPAPDEERERLRAMQDRVRQRGRELAAETERLEHSTDREALRAHIARLQAHHLEVEEFVAALESFHRRVGPLDKPS